jgi:RecA-family ATPase
MSESNILTISPVSLPMPAQEKPARKPLADFLVNHANTLGMSWEQIEQLRPPFVIDGFARRGEVMLLGAESKSRKSWLAQDAVFSVALGNPWLTDEDGENGFQTAAANVHILDLELSPDEMLFRFAKARGNRYQDCPESQRSITEKVFAYSFDGMNVLNILDRLPEIKETVGAGDLVVIDCLYRLAPDGNETVDVAAILETVKRFASETKAAVILVDHFRKAGADKARDRFAGTFIKQASASTLVAVEVKDDILNLNVDARTFHGCPLVHAFRFPRIARAWLAPPLTSSRPAQRESRPHHPRRSEISAPS